MKKIVIFLLFIQNGLIFAQSGKPCLPKDANRTKEQLVKELFLPENSLLLEEYRTNIRNLLEVRGETPLKNDADLKNIILKSEVLTKQDLLNKGVKTVTNGFKKTDRTIAYIKNDPVKDGYKYLSYKGIEYGALNCGNPLKVFKKDVKSQVEDVNYVYKKTVIIDTIEYRTYIQTPQQPPQQPATHPLYVWNPTPAFTPIPVSGGSYGPPLPVVQRPVFNFGLRVGVNVRQAPAPSYPYYYPYPAVQQPYMPVVQGGPVTPSHSGVGGPITPVQTGQGGPVTPRVK